MSLIYIVSETEALWCVENHQEYLEKCTILFSGLGYSLEQVALPRVCKLDEVAPSYDDVKTVNGHDYRRWKVDENGLLLDSSFAEFGSSFAIRGRVAQYTEIIGFRHKTIGFRY